MFFLPVNCVPVTNMICTAIFTHVICCQNHCYKSSNAKKRLIVFNHEAIGNVGLYTQYEYVYLHEVGNCASETQIQVGENCNYIT